jgi:hypothetical protein
MVNFAHLKSDETIENLRDGGQDKGRQFAFERSEVEMDRGRGTGINYSCINKWIDKDTQPLSPSQMG